MTKEDKKNNNLKMKYKIALIVAVIGALATIIGAVIANIGKNNSATEEATIEYVGRVIDLDSRIPIQGAKVTLDSVGLPQVVYTDAEGIYRFSFNPNSQNASVRIRVDASGYQIYDKSLEIDQNNVAVDDIRLNKTSIETPPDE